MDFKKLKNEKGITLIALAVTIVVLWILAGVTISSVFSENGIINKAQKAQETMDEARNKDLKALNELEKELAKYQGTNINTEDYETLTLKAYIGRFQRQCANYLRTYVKIYDKDNEENNVIFNIGTDWKENINTNNDTNNLILIDSSTKMEMVQNISNLNKNDYDIENKTIYTYNLNSFTDVELTFKAKKNINYGVEVVIQGADYDSNSNSVSMVNVSTYKGEWGENKEKIITREEVKRAASELYTIGTGDKISLESANNVSLAAQGYFGLSEYSFTVKTVWNSSNKALKLLNEKGTGAIDEKYIGFDFNRDGYIDREDENQIDAHMGGVSSW